MKIAELLRTIADIVDSESTDPAPEQAAIEIVAQDPDIVAQDVEMDQLAQLAGITRASTTPDEEVYAVQAVIPSGNDIHYSKNPADMRTDSISLYPGYGAHN